MFKTMKALIQREFWEHRGAFIKTPIIVGIVLLILNLVGYIVARVFVSKTHSQEAMQSGFQELSKLSPQQLSFFWDGMFIGTSVLYFLVMFFVLFFFCLGSLYDDRKDGSILFWKSLPINDSTTVLSKLITATIFVPLVTTVIFVAAVIALMILYSLLLLINGQNPITLVWVPAHIFSGSLTMLFGAVVQMLWALPIYGWLMFCSAWSKRRPFLFSIFIPLIVAVSWYVLNVITRMNFFQVEMFKLPLRYLSHAVLPYSTGEGTSFRFMINDETSISEVITKLKDSIANVEIVYGIIFAAIFIAISIWVRRYRNTT